MKGSGLIHPSSLILPLLALRTGMLRHREATCSRFGKTPSRIRKSFRIPHESDKVDAAQEVSGEPTYAPPIVCFFHAARAFRPGRTARGRGAGIDPITGAVRRRDGDPAGQGLRPVPAQKEE